MGSEGNGGYDHRSLVMENLLRSKEYWTVVESGYAQPSAEAQRKTLEEMKLKDLKAKNYLFQSLDPIILKTISQKETSKQLKILIDYICDDMVESLNIIKSAALERGSHTIEA